MANTKPCRTGSVLSACCVLLALSAITPATSFADDDELAFDKQFYLGLGAGVSRFDPLQVDGTAYGQNDTQSIKGAAVFGRDFTKRLTGEVQLMRSSTSLPDGGAEVKYRALSLTGQYYLWNSRLSSDSAGLARRQGFSAFGRAGISQIDANSTQALDRSRVAVPVAGAGIEYGFDNGFAVRADYLYHDGEFDNLSIWALYRMGRSVSESALPSAPPPPVAADSGASSMPGTGESGRADVAIGSTSSPVAPGKITPLVVAPQAPGSGGIDSIPAVASVSLYPRFSEDEDCSAVTENHHDTDLVATCQWQSEYFSDIDFSGSNILLSQEAQKQLVSLAQVLQRNQLVKLVIKGHSQSLDESQENLKLSRSRVLLVARYLLNQGVAASQVVIRAYGD